LVRKPIAQIVRRSARFDFANRSTCDGQRSFGLGDRDQETSGKLAFTGPVRAALARSGFTELLIDADDAELVGGLDWEHRDPFDRMLIAQCLNRTLSIVTAAEILSRRRDVPVVRAG
jgi:hypothetical protein